MTRRAPEVTRFIVVGCTNFAVSLAVFYLAYNYVPARVVAAIAPAALLHEPAAALANLLAYAAGMINSFLLNRSWTFRSSGDPLPQALRFSAVNLFSLVVSTTGAYLLVDALGFPYLPTWIALEAAVVVLNYVGCKYWAFAPAPLKPGAR